MRIAIIGAGISGLATAYNLKKKIPTADITIYERGPAAGGNALTFNVVLSNGRTRWVDMGVNDFNKATYKHMVALWKEIGFMNQDGTSKYCSPLINDASFSVGNDTPFRYYIDNAGVATVPSGGLLPQPEIRQGLKDFVPAIANWYAAAGDEEHAPRILVGDWATPKFSQAFIFDTLYPRINGMYFSQEDNPGNTPPPSIMPLWMVAHYYVLQEGYVPTLRNGDDLWDRQYFVNGSQTWLIDFAELLETKKMINPIIYNRAKMHVDRVNGKLVVYDGTQSFGEFDKVIFATHADDTLEMMDFKDRDNDARIPALKAFKYGSSNIYVHEDPSFVPSDDLCKRTYNIHMYVYTGPESKNKAPYTITYIVNRHQNDKPYDKDPLFYVTVNPEWNTKWPVKILPQPGGKPAVANFRHCQLDVKAMDAQVAIDKMQLRDALQHDFYYVGSFSRGAGLHEECVIQAEELAKKIHDVNYVSNQVYNFDEGAKHFAPRYMLDVLGIK